MDLEGYTVWIKEQGFRHVVGGKETAQTAVSLADESSDITNAIIDILESTCSVYTVGSNNLSRTEDYLMVSTGCDRLLRHFHVLWFVDDEGEISTILELAGRNDVGGLQWNLAYDSSVGFQKSVWVEAFAQSAIENNPNILSEAVENAEMLEEYTVSENTEETEAVED